ncbi:MAG TPA: hypothetical protein VLY03_07015 [Bacteroidota bacterium]|nr:hypothetical protein [Bacteroidota bacterium]
MHVQFHLSKDFKKNLTAVVNGTGTHQQLNHVVAVAHALAEAFLTSKRSVGTLGNMHGLNISDLAYDSIADLFQRDERGSFRQLTTYFLGLPLEDAGDEETLVYLRRLVFSKVNHSVFRLLSEADPSLAKILRNVKQSMQALRVFEEVERFGEICVVPSLCEPLEHLPSYERSELEADLLAVSTGDELIPEMLGKVARVLREECARCRIVPLVTVGLVIRDVYERKLMPGSAGQYSDSPMLRHDVTSVVASCCDEVKKSVSEKYVGKGRISCEMFETYFDVIGEELRNRYLGLDGEDSSLFELFKTRVPELTKEGYLEEHRNQLEYFLKLVNRKAVEQLKKG